MMTSIVDFATAVTLSLTVAYIFYRCTKTLYTVAVPESAPCFAGTTVRPLHVCFASPRATPTDSWRDRGLLPWGYRRSGDIWG